MRSDVIVLEFQHDELLSTIYAVERASRARELARTAW